MEVVIKGETLKKKVINGVFGYHLDITENLENYSLLPLIDEFYQDNVYHELLFAMKELDINNKHQRILSLLRIFNLDKEFLKRNIDDLSMMEKRITKYLCLFLNLKNTVIIMEPFKYLTSDFQKLVLNYLRNLNKRYSKTIILLSKDSNMIYENCDYYLIYDKEHSIYTNDISDIDFADFKVTKPYLVEFSDLVTGKNVNIGYFKDIRDLMKDVYRHV